MISSGLDAEGNIPVALAEIWWYEEIFGNIHDEVGANGRGVKRVLRVFKALRGVAVEDRGGESIKVLRLRGNLNAKRRFS